ncbi:hypothetical protein [Anaerolinea sp.]|uniref:lysophospholipid acyltransferase family protein n=1 Tax=Anaerolinea sp. TaxID=1872519 RepID=UPI002ACD85F1|nr:hypothetical protein [Anaerolinea sp.]
MNDRLYHTLRLLAAPFRYSCSDAGCPSPGQPAIFVANHCGPTGPIQSILSLPRRVYPWIVVDMLDSQKIVPYLYKDFVTTSLHLKGKPGWFLAKVIARMALPFLNSLGCIPVDRYDVRFSGAFLRSLELLEKGEALLIFPEDPLLPINPQTGMRPFMSGFLWLCVLYKRKTGSRLPVIPTAVIPAERKIYLGEPMYYREAQSPREDTCKMAQEVEKKISQLLAESPVC